MKWRGRRTSTRIQDRRGGGGMAIGGGRGLKVGGGATLAILLVGWFLGADPAIVLGA